MWLIPQAVVVDGELIQIDAVNVQVVPHAVRVVVPANEVVFRKAVPPGRRRRQAGAKHPRVVEGIESHKFPLSGGFEIDAMIAGNEGVR